MNTAFNKHIVVEIKNLNKSFNEKKVLINVNLNLNEGENLAILGKSGIGKSVLLKCISGLIYPDKGTIMVFDKDLLSLGDKELNKIRERIGYVFQNAALYDSMTIGENLLFPLERNGKGLTKIEKEELIADTLDSVGLVDVIDKMPSELSGGMRKRAGLARALISKPEIILYDEPTTGLDPVTSRDISKLIVKIQKKYKTSSIIVTHDMKCAELTSNRMLVLHDGHFIAEGAYSDLKNHNLNEVRDYFAN